MSSVSVKVDWLSFTCPGGEPDEKAKRPEWHIALRGVQAVSAGFARLLCKEGQLVDGAGRAPFRKSLRSPKLGISLFYGHKKNLVLVEISGHGCDTLRRYDGLEKLLEKCQNTVTRIDVATDFLSNVRPADFSENRTNDRFKSGSSLHSPSGETVYIGSHKSNRYARVYRYAPPHPRSALLRAEMVSRDEDARLCVAHILREGTAAAAKALGNAFGWTHPLWNELEATDTVLEAYRNPDRGGNTTRWLYTQVLPAIEKMLDKGHQVSINEWVAAVATLCYTYSQQVDPNSNE